MQTVLLCCALLVVLCFALLCIALLCFALLCFALFLLSFALRAAQYLSSAERLQPVLAVCWPLPPQSGNDTFEKGLGFWV